MGLLSFLKPTTSARPRPAAEPPSAELARARARRRLIGAAVLVVLGVIGLPLLFDTAPRPLPVDIPIEIPSKDRAPALVAAPAKPAAASAPVAPTPVPASTPTAEPAPPVKVEAPSEPASAAAPPAQAESARALAALEDKPPAAAPKSVDAARRFVVQVGAYSEAESARAARARVEKLGLESYTQVVETASGKRIRVRVGPYDERAEAEQAAARLEKAGLPTAVLGL